MRILVTLLSLVFFGTIAVVGAVIIGIQIYSQDLPDYSVLKDYAPPTLTRLHAGDGRLLAEFAAERRVFVPYEAIPERVRNAFIAAEDKDFYNHQGVDFQSVIRAGVQNFEARGSGKRPVGASTITQQVARNFFLTNEVSYTRKIREILLAFRLERALSKERILELYLNQIFLGERSYGVAAAAQGYFNKSLDELTVAECAYLASLPKAPNNYNPTRNHEAALTRRNWVIGRMHEEGYVTQAEMDTALKEPLAIADRDGSETVTADYFAEEVRRELVDKYSADAVLQGGLYVRTSVNPKLQVEADKALREGLMAYDRRHGYRGPVAHNLSLLGWPAPLKAIQKPLGAEGWELVAVTSASATEAAIATMTSTGTMSGTDYTWSGGKLKRGDVVLAEKLEGNKFALRQVPLVQGGLVSLDPNTGRVLAMSGGFSHAMSVFNRVTQAQRQPGSSFKPFVYMAALDNGFNPSSLIVDGPIALPQGPGLPIWRPENYEHDFLGPSTLRTGVEKSRNLMTIRLAHAIGMDKVADITKRFGINDNLPKYLAMAIGAIDTTPLKMATAYGMIVNGGKQIAPSFVDMVQDRRGRTVWRRGGRLCTACMNVNWQPGMAVPEIPDPRAQIEDPRTTGQMVSIMEGVVQRGTAAALKKTLNFPVAGKTGTTNESRDVWFIGFTPDLVTAVYVGYDDPKSLGKHETGATVAVPIFGQFMKAAMTDRPKVPFRVPEGLRFVRIDPRSGQEVEPGTPGAIWEGYKPGTEPGAAPQTILRDGEVAGEEGVSVEGESAADGVSVDEGSSNSSAAGQPVDNSIPGVPTAPGQANTPTLGKPEEIQGTGGLY